MKTQAQFTFEKVKHDQENDVHLVVSLTAPKIDWQEKRPPVCITLVADVSGSMSGTKLEYVKQSMIKLIDHLQPGDYCGLVTFESSVYAISQPVEMTQARKDDLKAKVGALHTMGGTNFSGGMLQGLDFANKVDLPAKVVNRIIMFTDGCANEGVATQRPDVVKLMTANLGKASISAFGYGTDADQELLADVAKHGRGNYAFIKNPDDALKAFAKELGGLLSTYAQNIEVLIEPHNGHKVVEVVSDVDVTEDSGKVTIRIPDILSEEERHLVLAMRLSKQAQALPRDMSVVDVALSYDLIAGTGKKTREQASIKAKVRFVKPGEEQDKPTPDVDKIVGLARMVKVQIEAEQLAQQGNYGGAVQVMSLFSAEMAAAGYDGLSAASANIGSRLGSHSVYVQNAGYLNSTRTGGTRGVGLSGSDDAALCDLHAAGAQLSTSSQSHLMHQWQGPAQPNPAIGGAVVIGAVPAAPPAAPPAQPVLAVPPSTPQASKPKPSKGLSKKRSKRW